MKPRIARARILLCSMAAAMWTHHVGAAETIVAFPAKALRMIVPYAPGGSVDVLARSLAQNMTVLVQQQVLVDNRPGASGNIGTELAVRAPADGYTILMTTIPLVLNPSLYPSLPFDVTRDLAPVSLIGAVPFVLVVHPALAVRSVADLVGLAKKQPGKLNYPSGGNGTNSHIAAELFRALTATDIVHVPYKGGGPALVATLSGEANLAFLGLDVVMPHVRTGRLRALAVTSAKRSPLVGELPTIAEAGVPGYQFSSWYGVLAPAATPSRLIDALNQYVVKAVRQSDLGERLEKEGTNVVVSSPGEFAAHIRAELQRWAKVVKQAGIRAD